LNLGYALSDKGQLDAAIACYNKAIALDPKNAAAHNNLGAILCDVKHDYDGAIACFRKAIELDPNKASYRSNAACAAALIGCSRLKDAKPLDDKERARWRKQAIEWLRADLTLLSKQADSGKPSDRVEVAQLLQHCQRDADFAGIRDAKELAKLPADERQACEKLWADVAALLKKAGEETK
jgi:Flp pilus assembly protein TadD